MRVNKNAYIMDWERNRVDERTALLKSGKRPYKNDLQAHKEKGTPLDFLQTYPIIFGQASSRSCAHAHWLLLIQRAPTQSLCVHESCPP